MSGDFQVNHAQLTDASGRTAAQASAADSIKGKVAAANGQVPSKAWGLLGNLTVYHAYTEMLGQLNDHVSDMIQSVQKLASDIKTTADQYKQNEDDVAKSFQGIQNDLDGESSDGGE